MIQIGDESFINVNEAAEMINRSPRTIYQFYRDRYKWTPHYLGRSLYFSMEEISQWLAAQLMGNNPAIKI